MEASDKNSTMKFIIEAVISLLVLLTITTRLANAAIPEQQSIECALNLKVIDVTDSHESSDYYKLTVYVLSVSTVKNSNNNVEIYNCQNMHTLNVKNSYLVVKNAVKNPYLVKKTDIKLRQLCKNDIVSATVTGRNGLHFLPLSNKQRLSSFLNNWLAKFGLKRCFNLE